MHTFKGKLFNISLQVAICAVLAIVAVTIGYIITFIVAYLLTGIFFLL